MANRVTQVAEETLQSGGNPNARVTQVATETLVRLTVPVARGNIDYDQIQGAVRQGNGTKFQMFGGGSMTTGHLAVYDANGNVIDGGGTLAVLKVNGTVVGI
jgi:hypothetical protein